MRGAHLADLHLGYRAFQATINGRNAREVDVEEAWWRVVSNVCVSHEIQPIDLITIAGDVFHHPRVSDFAKRAFLRGIHRLLTETDAAIIVLQGNHDAGRTAEVLTPIALADGMGAGRLFLVTEPKRIKLQTRGQKITVDCFPFVSRRNARTYELEPDPQADVNILLMHAAVRGDKVPYFYGGEQALDIRKEADRYDAILLGDYHEFTQLVPNRPVFYSGSIERTSSNIWQEEAPKGWVLWEPGTDWVSLEEVPTRPMDNHVIAAATAEEVNDVLRDMAAVRDRSGLIVRLLVQGFKPAEREHVDWKSVRAMKEMCLHFQLDLQYDRPEVTDLGDRREGAQRSLAAEAQAFFAEDPREVRELAFRYLDVEALVEDEGIPLEPEQEARWLHLDDPIFDDPDDEWARLPEMER